MDSTSAKSRQDIPVQGLARIEVRQKTGLDPSDASLGDPCGVDLRCVKNDIRVPPVSVERTLGDVETSPPYVVPYVHTTRCPRISVCLIITASIKHGWCVMTRMKSGRCACACTHKMVAK